MTIINKPEAFLKLGKVNTFHVHENLKKLTDEFWYIENSRKENDYPVFGHTQHIIFRFIHENINHQNYYTNPIWHLWKSSLKPILNQAVSCYQFSHPIYPKVMLARLKAGGIIGKHVDGKGSNLCTHKIHIPIQTNKEAIFMVDGVNTHLEEGVAYEINNLLPHGAKNTGSNDRIHLIFEVYDQDKQ